MEWMPVNCFDIFSQPDSEVPIESTQVMPQWVNSKLLQDSTSANVGKLGGSGTF